MKCNIQVTKEPAMYNIKKKIMSISKLSSYICTFYILISLSSTVFASGVCQDISDLPMEITINAAPPNIIYLLDDSGSMDWSVMTPDDNGVFRANGHHASYIFDRSD
jgi:hypothetical protein